MDIFEALNAIWQIVWGTSLLNNLLLVSYLEILVKMPLFISLTSDKCFFDIHEVAMVEGNDGRG